MAEAKFALKLGRVEIVKLLLRHTLDNTSVITDLFSDGLEQLCCLHHAARQGCRQVLRKLLVQVEDVDVLGSARVVKPGCHVEENITPFWLACFAGHLSSAKLLLHNGADLGRCSDAGTRPLMAAAGQGHARIVNYLLKHEAAINLQDGDRHNALMHAVMGGWEAAMAALLKRGADPLATDKRGRTALHLCARAGHGHLVKHLALAGSRIRAGDCAGSTALHIACNHGHVEVVQELLKVGATLSVKDNYGLTPLQKAAEAGQEAVVKLLVEKPSVDAKEKVEALELLASASSRYDEYFDVTKSFKIFSEAFKLRRENKNMMRKKALNTYDEYQEFQTMDEFQKIKDNSRRIAVEGLLAARRIIGPKHPKIAARILLLSRLFLAAADADKFVFWIREAVHIRQLHGLSVVENIRLLVSHLCHLFYRGYDVTMKAAVSTMHCCLQELKRNKAMLKKPSADITIRDERETTFEQNLCTSLCLLLLLNRLQSEQKHFILLKRIVEELDALSTPTSVFTGTILHLAASRILLTDRYMQKFVAFPSLELVCLLLACGLNPNEVDSEGNTALHLVVSNSAAHPLTAFLLTSLLLAHGALRAPLNHAGERPRDLAVPPLLPVFHGEVPPLQELVENGRGRELSFPDVDDPARELLLQRICPQAIQVHLSLAGVMSTENVQKLQFIEDRKAKNEFLLSILESGLDNSNVHTLAWALEETGQDELVKELDTSVVDEIEVNTGLSFPTHMARKLRFLSAES